MKYLNLTKGFNPFNAKDYELIAFESFFFSGGEPHIKLDMSTFNGKKQDVQVSIRLKSMNDFGMLAVATEALKQCGKLGNCYLFIPYFPGARQDRRVVDGEPLTVGVFAHFINELQYDNVEIFDPHSDVTPAVIQNSDPINNHKFVRKVRGILMGDDKPISAFHYISPDAGSNKKIFKLMQELDPRGFCSVVKCDKTRNTENGKITNFEVYKDDLEGKPCIIIDDICDGGGTFIGLAEELKKKNAGDIYLAVSHGIFSKPLRQFKDSFFKKIFTTDSWVTEFDWERIERDTTDIVQIIPFNEFLS